MRLRFPLVVLFVALTAAAVGSTAAEPNGRLAPPQQVFILAGQSNMLGRGFPLSQAEHSDPRLLLWRGGAWRVAADPLGQGDSLNGIGPGMTFGLQALPHLPGQSIGLVMCAIGGSKMSTWLPTGRSFKACMNLVHAAGDHVAAMLFLQGESDSKDEDTARAWSGEFGQMAAGLRATFGLLIPIVIGQIGKLPSQEFPYQGLVRSQQVNASAANPEVPIFSTIDLPVNGEGHFTVSSYKAVGARFAAAWWQLTGGVPPPPAPDFALHSLPPSAQAHVGEAAKYTLSATQTHGFSKSVSLSVSGVPRYATASFGPGTIGGASTSTLTVTPSESTETGTYTMTVTGTSGFMIRTTKVTLTVLGPVPDFSVRAGLPSDQAQFGHASQVTYRVRAASQNGFAGPIAFSLAGLPASLTGAFAPPALTLSSGDRKFVTLTVSTTAATPRGTYPLAISATSNGITHRADATLVVD